MENKIINKIVIKYFVTFFGTGLVPKFQGTVATFASSILFYFLIIFLNLNVLSLVVFTLLFFLVSIKLVNLYQLGSSEHDPKEIVVDEVLGTIIFLLALPISTNKLAYIFFGFIIFRVLDYLKPSVIYRFQCQETNLSILLDDIMAALFTLLIVLSLDLNGMLDGFFKFT